LEVAPAQQAEAPEQTCPGGQVPASATQLWWQTSGPAAP
jgi:hypothetical protein